MAKFERSTSVTVGSPPTLRLSAVMAPTALPPTMRTFFLRLSAMSEELRGIEGIGEVDGLTCTREL